MKKIHQRQGFTLIEVLVYISLLGLLVTILISSFWDVMFASMHVESQSEVQYYQQQIHKRISAGLRQAGEVVTLSSSEICLHMDDAAMDPLSFKLVDGEVLMGWGGGGSDCTTPTNEAALTGPSVVVDELLFEDLTRPGFTEKMVRFVLSISTSSDLYAAGGSPAIIQSSITQRSEGP